RIAEVPVHWHHVANSRIRPLADSMSMMADLVRTRIGQRMPSIPGTVIRSTTGGAPWREARSAVGPTMPVVQQRGNEALVLFPMCGKDEVGRMRALLEERILDGEFRPVCLTIADLDNMTQLSEVRPCTTDIPHAKTDQNGPAAAPD
ncbi:MAG TPA: hypothetical protein VHZ02_10845, partial [Acidimicrobiales bacterium]|nr:hypothetical protein [Acidimicrobiales bacterium]